MRMFFVALSAALSLNFSIASAQELLPAFKVAGNLNVFATQLAYGPDGSVYTVNVEPSAGASTGINLRTVVRQGKPKSTGGWTWTSKVIETRTMDDPYHTQPSIAVDRSGRIHVAFNMHNMPWQYARSVKANDITSFQFLGEAVSDDLIKKVKFQNMTPFPNLGKGAIPGTQVTYPSFYTDRKGELYVTYRQAIRPKRAFAEREYGCGIARYNVSTGSWQALGAQIAVTTADAAQAGKVTAFCVQAGWWAYQPRLWFDAANTMHVSWAWRKGNAGGDCTNLSYAYSNDGGKTFRRTNGQAYSLPITVNAGQPILANAATKVACRSEIDGAPSGKPMVSFQYYGKAFSVVERTAAGGWGTPVAASYGGQTVLSGGTASLWSLGSSGRVAKGTSLSGRWSLVHQDPLYCVAKGLPMPAKKLMLVHLQSCDNTKVKVVSLPW